MHVYSTHTCSIIVLLEIFTEILVYAVHIHDDVHYMLNIQYVLSQLHVHVAYTDW